ncbi:MAG: hypothetical protein ACYCUX_04600 [Metallibacterium sp.]
MNASSNKTRRLGLMLVAALTLLAAPLAMADGLGFSLGLFGPGYGLGYSGCGDCRDGGFVSGYMNSGWGWGDRGYGDDDGGDYYPAPVYYQPAPAYYGYERVYRRPVVERVYTRRYYSSDDGWRGRWREGDRGYWRNQDGRGYRGDQRGDHSYWHDRGRRDEGRGQRGGDGRRGGDHGYWRDRNGGGGRG